MAQYDIKSLDKWDSKSLNKLIISGPCSAESESQLLQTAIGIAAYNVDVLRAGIWKPRTRPNSFEGVGEVGLTWLKKAGRIINKPVMVEVANPRHVEQCLEHGIDIVWIGARTTASPFSVQSIADALKGVDIPVWVKNPINPDIELWIGAIERLSQSGLPVLGAIHRGFSSFHESNYRNRPHWGIATELRQRFPNLPLICDPSHICGNRDMLLTVSQIAMDLLFDGLMIESHIYPEYALSDAKQQLSPDDLGRLLANLETRRQMTKEIHYNIQIEKLGHQIDEIDSKLISLLEKRMSIVKVMGEKKKNRKISSLQSGRWVSFFENKLKSGMETKLPHDFLMHIFKAIHKESIRIQRCVTDK